MTWELCVIGTALADPSSMVEAEILMPSDFTPPNNIIWAEMLSLNSRQALDTRALTEILKHSPDAPTIASGIGTVEGYLQHALTFRGSAMKEYTNHVLSQSIRRAVRRSAALIAAEAQDDRRTAEDLLEYAEKAVLSLRRNRMNEGVTIGDILGVFIPRLQAFRDGTFTPAWVPHTLAVRRMVEFAEASDFWINAARPGEGKSSWMRYEFFHAALNGMRPIIFNLENDYLEYARYIIALDTNINSKRLKNPSVLTPHELELVRSSAERIARLPLKIITLGGPSVADVASIARRLVADWKANLIGVDYLQLIRNGIERRVEDVSITTGSLRALALETNIPIMANSQLSRDIEKRGIDQSEPQLSDLRDSGSIEQDGTIVTFLRSAWTDPSEAEIVAFPENRDASGHALPNLVAVPIKIFVKKNRNGETGVSEIIKWNKATGNFQTMVRNESVRQPR